MGLIIDAIIVLIIIISSFLGYKKGLTKSFLKIFTFIIALVISFELFKPISNIIINNTDIDENLQKAIEEKFNQSEENKQVEQRNDENSEKNDMPTIFNNFISEKINDATAEAKDVIVKEASKQIAITIINVGVVILVYIISQIVLIFIKGITDLVTKLPVIKQCDKLGGVIYGLLRAAIILIIIFTIISLIAPIINSTVLLDMINDSIIGSKLYNNNIIFNIIF